MLSFRKPHGLNIFLGCGLWKMTVVAKLAVVGIALTTSGSFSTN